MALTLQTGMTPISNADSLPANSWAAYRLAGSGGAPSASLSSDVFKEGSGAISTKAAGNGWDAGLLFDYYSQNSNAVLNLSAAGNEVLTMWVQITTPAIIQALSAGGAYIIVQSSTETGTTAPTVYSRWYVSGSDVYPGGWVLFMVDTRKTPSNTAGGGANLAQVRRIGFGLKCIASVGTVKADNLFVDAMWYGRPRYQVIGDGSTVATWQDFITHSAANVNGLITDIGGANLLSCGIRFGSSSQGSTTTFTDATGKQLIFRRHTYHNGTSVVDALTYSDLYVVDANGTATIRTAVTIGSGVGSGDARQGVLGGGIRSADVANITWKMDFQTNKANLSVVKLYGLDIAGAKGGVLLDNDSGGTETTLVSVAFSNCGEVDPGATGSGAEILNCVVIDPNGGTGGRGMRLRAAHRVKLISFVTSGSPATQRMVYLPDGGTYSIAFDGLKFFGDFSSGTLYHAEAAGSGTITINASNGSTIVGSEIEKPGGATVNISNPITLTLTGMASGSEVRIYSAGTTTELDGVESSGTSFAFQYNFSPNTYVDIVVHHITRIYYRLEGFLLAATNASLPITQQADRQYQNP